MIAKSLRIVGGLAALLIGAQVHAAVVFEDEFDGAVGTPADAAKWNFFGSGSTSHTGAGTLGLDSPAGGDAKLISDTSFAPAAGETLTATWEFTMAPGNGFIGLYDDGANLIIVYENGNIATSNGGVIGNVGGLINTNAFHTLEIEWSASQLRVLFDGSQKVSTTDLSQIPSTSIPIPMYALRYGGAGRTELYHASIDIIPEPAMLGALSLGGLALMRRRAC